MAEQVLGQQAGSVGPDDNFLEAASGGAFSLTAVALSDALQGATGGLLVPVGTLTEPAALVVKLRFSSPRTKSSINTYTLLCL